MKLGIFAKTFKRSTVAATLDEVRAHGLTCTQFNLSVAGLPTLPDHVPAALIGEIQAEAKRSGVELAAISGTFNMIDLDRHRRTDNLRRLARLCDAAALIGIPTVTLCTGTRDTTNMWQRHPANDDKDTWDELIRSMREAERFAANADVTLAFEPELANVVSSTQRAKRLLDELGSPHLGVVLDPANLVPRTEAARVGEAVEEALELVGTHIKLAHLKEIPADADAEEQAIGDGLLDLSRYLDLLTAIDFAGALIIHGVAERDVSSSVSRVRAALATLDPQSTVA